MKKDANRKNSGDLGWLESLRVISNVTIRQSAYNFLFILHMETTCLSFHDLARLRVICRKSQFFVAQMYLSLLRVTPLELHRDLRLQKTREHGLLCDVPCVNSRFDRTLTLIVSDRQTDRGQSIYRASTAQRGKNGSLYMLTVTRKPLKGYITEQDIGI